MQHTHGKCYTDAVHASMKINSAQTCSILFCALVVKSSYSKYIAFSVYLILLHWTLSQ
ncbi:hypothetical protein BD408DRAFT_408264 [Parasitella parasitica]|nr:hypothetical protein BD408DRAFT_408264 [Parasitella parasitica]